MSKRCAILEKDVAQADLLVTVGKADRFGEMSTAVPQSLCRGNSDSIIFTLPKV